VWTPEPARGARRPVLVFVHCGGFVAGSPNTPMYDGQAFARDGVVCVTVSYRLGTEGFLAFPDGTANLGLQDQLAAMRWVQEEIDAFGGDPGRVTMAGQSAGAMSIGYVLGGPAGRGLAQRAISQSGGLELTYDVMQALQLTQTVADAVGVGATREALRAVPIARLVNAAAALTPDSVDFGQQRHPGGGLIIFAPVRDGITVAEEPIQGLASAGLDSLLAGTTLDEGNLFLAGKPDPGTCDEAWHEAELVVGRFADAPRRRLDEARANRPDAAPRELASALLTETLYRAPTRRIVDASVAAGVRTYVYEFAWRSRAVGGRLGACHCVELPAVFETQREPGLLAGDGLLGVSGYPERLAVHTHDAWVRFVRDGDPGWLAATEDEYRSQRIDEHSTQLTTRDLGVDASLP
jgi:para-nitrobenzyl esterase